MSGWDGSFDFDPTSEPLEDKWLYSLDELRSARRFSLCLGGILATGFWLTLYGVFFA